MLFLGNWRGGLSLVWSPNVLYPDHLTLGGEADYFVLRLKDGDWLSWDPMHHWTDRKIRIHAFYCMLGISLLHHVHKQAQAGWADLSMEQLLEELEQIKQFVLLYPPQGEKGPARTAYVLSQQTLAQQALVKTLGLERLHRSTPRG